ncbi:MAG TPA: PKD domain-containing protein [Phycisphaerales bacterium]|nr:PKD domain-containing protein [Phycisphaerales bacterium]
MLRAVTSVTLGASAVVLAALAGGAQAQLRVANWNISFYDGTDRAAAIQTAVYGVFNGKSMAPDVFSVQEVSTAGALSTLVNVLNSAPGSPGDWAAAPFIDGPDSESVLLYRTSKVDLLNTEVIALGSTASTNQPRNTYRYDLRAKGYTTTSATFAVYSVHMKAGDTSSDNARRLVESTNIRDNASGMDTNGAGTALPAGYHYILAGDMNMQNAGQSSYQELISGVGGNAGRFYDPICRPGIYYTPGSGTDAGNWNNNAAFQMIHTQDPATSAGMDDRHDQILLGGSLVDGVGMDYIGNPTQRWNLNTFADPNHSYRCWGNDGTTFNAMLRTTGNAHVGATIAQALIDAATTSGGHLPVFLDLRVPAKVSTPVSVNFGTVVQGSTAQQSVSIGNGGNTALWTANGIASLSYTLTASGGFTAPGGTFNDAPGGGLNAHTVSMNTATVGPKNGTITINATGADVPSVVVNVTGTVIAANQPPVANAGADQTVTDTDNSGSETVTLDGSASNDPDGTITDYRWSEGATVLAQGPSPTASVPLGVGVHTITLTVTDNSSATHSDTVVVTVEAGATCGPQDFNGDGDSGTDQDIEAFFACLGGNCCPACWPAGADFNGDGDIGTDQDIEAFFRVLGGSPC